MLNKGKGKIMMSEIQSEAQLAYFSIDTINIIYKTKMDSNQLF